ncbi:MAG: CSLREA domain-containing protein, partial [bacterium]
MVRAALWVMAMLLAARAGAMSFAVTTTADVDDGICDAHCSLREAVRAANARLGGDEITLPDGVYRLSHTGAREDAAASGDLDVTDDLRLAGSDARRCIIDGVGADRLLQVFNATLELHDVTLRHGAVRAEDG